MPPKEFKAWKRREPQISSNGKMVGAQRFWVDKHFKRQIGAGLFNDSGHISRSVLVFICGFERPIFVKVITWYHLALFRLSLHLFTKGITHLAHVCEKATYGPNCVPSLQNIEEVEMNRHTGWPLNPAFCLAQCFLSWKKHLSCHKSNMADRAHWHLRSDLSLARLRSAWGQQRSRGQALIFCYPDKGRLTNMSSCSSRVKCEFYKVKEGTNEGSVFISVRRLFFFAWPLGCHLHQGTFSRVYRSER